MEKVIIVVGDDVSPEHVRTIRDQIVREGHVAVEKRVSVDDFMLSDLDLETTHGDGMRLFESKSNEHYLKLANMHIGLFGFVVAVVFDRRSHKYCHGTVNKALAMRAPLTKQWVSSKRGQLKLVA